MLKKLLNFMKVNKDYKQIKEKVEYVKFETKEIETQKSLQQDKSYINKEIYNNQIENNYNKETIKENDKSFEITNKE